MRSICQFFILGIGILLLSSLVMAQAQQVKPDPCKAPRVTQQGLNECANAELLRAELRLEKLLKQLGIERDNPAQKAWEAYRDIQLAAFYPPENAATNGSAYPMCLANLKKRLTEGRIRDLKALTRTQEGDVCNGYRVQSR